MYSGQNCTSEMLVLILKQLYHFTLFMENPEPNSNNLSHNAYYYFSRKQDGRGGQGWGS